MAFFNLENCSQDSVRFIGTRVDIKVEMIGESSKNLGSITINSTLSLGEEDDDDPPRGWDRIKFGPGIAPTDGQFNVFEACCDPRPQFGFFGDLPLGTVAILCECENVSGGPTACAAWPKDSSTDATASLFLTNSGPVTGNYDQYFFEIPVTVNYNSETCAFRDLLGFPPFISEYILFDDLIGEHVIEETFETDDEYIVVTITITISQP